jgi:hypothetical protein
MLVPREEIESLHSPPQLADHVTRYALAALGAGPAVIDRRPRSLSGIGEGHST